MIKESTILERIGEAVDELDKPHLAQLHNDLTNYPPITSNQIEFCEGWHLIPLEGAH